MEKPRQRKIVLVDDHALFRNGLKGLINAREGYEVTSEFSDGTQFLNALPSLSADVVFMDIAMPAMNGDIVTAKALQLRPEMKIITLSMFGDQHYYWRMIEAGACGFLLKDSEIDEVFRAIETVLDGGHYICDTLFRSLSHSFHSSRGEVQPSEDELTERERDVLLGICRGESNQEIADNLFISKRTVETHRANILEKTGCKNTASLVIYAVKQHLIEV